MSPAVGQSPGTGFGVLQSCLEATESLQKRAHSCRSAQAIRRANAVRTLSLQSSLPGLVQSSLLVGAQLGANPAEAYAAQDQPAHIWVNKVNQCAAMRWGDCRAAFSITKSFQAGVLCNAEVCH